MNCKLLTFRLSLVLCLLSVLAGGRSFAAGGISIAPTRIVMDGNSRIATVYLSNKGDTDATFRVMLRDKHMLESGQIVDLGDEELETNSAKPYIRYSPRRVVIPPRGNQTIRLKLRNPSEGALPRGEYRTHLVFQSIPMNMPSANEDHIQATAIIETSIPVIVRRLAPEAVVELSEAWVDTTDNNESTPTLNINLVRNGQRSIYGDVNVFLKQASGDPEQVAVISGLAVYFPTPQRSLKIPLQRSFNGLKDESQLLVEFTETAAGHGDLQTRLVLPLDEGAFLLK
jgi:P pilus assembly chaperone PapD